MLRLMPIDATFYFTQVIWHTLSWEINDRFVVNGVTYAAKTVMQIGVELS